MKPLSNNQRLQKQHGLTLIELMVALAIVGLLIALVYPRYQNYVSHARRVDAQTQLLSAQQWMERLYNESFDYAQSAEGKDVASLLALQAFRTSPRAGEGLKAYDISVTVASPNPSQSFVLTAKRTALGPAAADACGDFTLDHHGVRGLVNNTKSLAECWK
jgi:type IV pilus assembly protein PilE